MRRRALAAIALALLGCRAPDPAARQAAPPALLTQPARALALGAADLPGLTLRDELVPGAYATGDPFGRVGSYSATFSHADGGLVISSVNTYVGESEAQAAFAAWRDAVPRQYQTISLPVHVAETVSYSRDGDVLFGYRVRNVLGSLRAPAAQVERLARVVLSRCDKS